MSTLEKHYRDLCDIEFTIERGRLWMLQTRIGKRTAAAAFTIAAELVEEGIIDDDEALRRVTGGQLDPAHVSPLRPGAGTGSFGHRRGRLTGSGHRTGRLRLTPAAAAATEPVILVRRETSPDDLPGMIAAAGILTSRGGKTSHAAVVARGMGKTCVCGADTIEVDEPARQFTVNGTMVATATSSRSTARPDWST